MKQECEFDKIRKKCLCKYCKGKRKGSVGILLIIIVLLVGMIIYLISPNPPQENPIQTMHIGYLEINNSDTIIILKDFTIGYDEFDLAKLLEPEVEWVDLYMDIDDINYSRDYGFWVNQSNPKIYEKDEWLQ